jgi:Uma2 family endonuclease
MAVAASRRLRSIPQTDEVGDPLSFLIPANATTLEGFRAWALSPEFPQRGRVSFLDGCLIVDMSPEELETHNMVKTAVTSRLFLLTDSADSGRLYGDRTLVTHKRARLSTEPDCTFVSYDSLQKGTVRLVPRKDHPGEYMEVEGSPDWVLEIISRSSWRKDTQRLRRLYAKAGIREYWLINALTEPLEWQILQLRGKTYLEAPVRREWQLSEVFGHEFRLVRTRTKHGYWRYQLKARAV